MPKKKILVVDDEEAIVGLFVSRLTSVGFDVISAYDGEEAFEKSRKEKPDLIIMDVLMPKMSGYEAVQKIRNEAELRDVPVIVISGKSGMKDFFNGILNVEFLSKPFDAKVLVNRVEALIGGPSDTVNMPNGSKRAVLLGVEDFITEKIRTLLHEQGFQVLTALSEADALKMAKGFSPQFVLCQFWEDEHLLDPKKIAQGLASQLKNQKTSLIIYSQDAIALEAMKFFPPSQLLIYSESADLLSSLRNTLNTGMVVSGR